MYTSWSQVYILHGYASEIHCILDAAVAPYLAVEAGESLKGGNRESML